jgi:hypothetical protein
MLFLEDKFENQFDDLFKIEMYKKAIFALPGQIQYGYTDKSFREDCDELNIKYKKTDSKVKLCEKIAKQLSINYKKKYNASNAFDNNIKDNKKVWKAYITILLDWEKCLASSNKSKLELKKKICNTIQYKQHPDNPLDVMGTSKACHVNKRNKINKFEKKFGITYQH